MPSGLRLMIQMKEGSRETGEYYVIVRKCRAIVDCFVNIARVGGSEVTIGRFSKSRWMRKGQGQLRPRPFSLSVSACY
jgi:hypothetical protein